MNISENDYKRWKKMALFICKDEFKSEESLQEALLNVVIKDKKDPKWADTGLTDNFIFISIRNYHINTEIKEKNKGDRFQKYMNTKTEEGDVMEDAEQRILDESGLVNEKIKYIEKIMLGMDNYSQQLYVLYFIRKMTYRGIASATGINHMVIFNQIKKIKEYIKEQYGKNKSK